MLCFFVIFVCLTSWVQAQNGRGPQQLDHNGHGWDIRLAVPGKPGNDYPTLGTIPRTSFSCAGREPGYYADVETNCQVFRVCTVGSTYGFQSFLCPNGTLFNQAVFVCDWWMNVNCENNEKLFTYNNNQFENLRLGPQLMKDIKKMLTYPMRNPYDKSAMKANVIVMQDYKPPAGQLFPNGALLAGPERAPNNVYVPKQNLIQNAYNNENTFSGSTVDPKYAPTAFTTIRPTTYRDSEFLQRQIQYDQSNRLQSTPPAAITSNGHTGQFAQYQNSPFTNSNSQLQRPIQNNNVRNAPYIQRQSSSFQTSNTQNFQRGQFNRQPLNDNRKASYTNNVRQVQSSVSFPQQQINNTLKEFSLPSKNTSPQKNTLELTEEAHKEVKNDVVSNLNAVSSTIVTKIVPFSRIVQESKINKFKPRITVKTWIVKPTKAAKLIDSPTSYTYNKPTQPQNNNLIDYTTPYFYDPPGTQSPTESIFPEVDNGINYTYNNPTIPTAQTITINSEVTQFDVSPTPTKFQRLLPTISGRLDEEPTTAPPTQASRFYLVPSTRQPTGRLYLPPSPVQPILSRQYLSPIMQTPVISTSAQLRASSTTPSPASKSPKQFSNNPGFRLTKPNQNQTRLSLANANRNLSFTDILTKDKLEVTVNDIVTDTHDILKTASPPKFGKYRSDIKTFDYTENNFAPTDSVTDSGERLTPRTPAVTQSSLITSYPSRKLEPPNISYSELNANSISNLPYFKESLLPPTNTIERTVTLRITIPEKLASYLFRSNNQSDYDKLEILNTGSSNYLVLSNNLVTPSPSFIPLGKLVDKNSDNFNSQALVFSLLADSINAAKEYSNYAQREVLTSTPATPNSQYHNNQDATQLSNQISQLTASQFANNNFNSNPNIITPSATLIQENQIRSNSIYTDNQLNQGSQIPTTQFSNSQQPQLQNNYYSTQFQPNANTLSANLLANGNQLYSGQLYQFPVPEVTNQIYNRPFSSNLIQPNNIPTNLQQSNSLQLTNINRNAPELGNQPSSAVQIVPSQTLPFNSAKLPSDQLVQSKSFNRESITNLLNSDNGISAQLRDRIIGTIPHPSEDNKLVTYEKDQSFYFTSNLNEKRSNENIRSNEITSNNIVNQSANNAHSNFPDLLTFQFIPSVSYELQDKKEQQQILDTFQIDEFGAPRDVVKSNLMQNKEQGRNVATINENKDFSANQPVSAKQIDITNNNISPLYNGPSSYLAPQSSVGNLRTRPETVQNNLNSRLEDFDEDSSNGYPKTRPTREFTF